MRKGSLVAVLAAALLAAPAVGQDMKRFSLRIDGRDVQLPQAAAARMAAIAQEMMTRCGPNTLLHRDNFGAAAARASARWEATEAAPSRLHVVYARPFETHSHLGGRVPVSEVLIGFNQDGYLVGPDFSRDGAAPVEHIGCDYLAALELACMPELAPHVSAAHRQTCARLERGPDGRIVLPPPDIAPSCS